MGRSPCCPKEGVNRGAWTAMEDKKLSDYIQMHGQGKWRNVPKKAGLSRCGKSCRLRWLNYLRPGIKRGNITNDEEELIIRLHKLLGNRWSLIAGRLPERTDNEIKNYWNTIIGKKLQNQAIPSSIHNQLNQSQQKQPNPNIKNSISQNANNDDDDHHANKVVIPSEPRNDDHIMASDDKSTREPSLLDFSLKEDNNSSDILLDFGMDEQLLFNFDLGAFSDSNICYQSQLFSDSDKSFLVSNDYVMLDSGFPLIDPSEFDRFS